MDTVNMLSPYKVRQYYPPTFTTQSLKHNNLLNAKLQRVSKYK